MSEGKLNKRKKGKPAQAAARPVSLGRPRKIAGTSGGERKQYPSKVGYHGSGEEKTLSPEE